MEQEVKEAVMTSSDTAPCDMLKQLAVTPDLVYSCGFTLFYEERFSPLVCNRPTPQKNPDFLPLSLAVK